MIYVLFIILACFSMGVLIYLKINFVISFIISFFILVIFNIVIGHIIGKFQRKVLDWDCDPIRFLKMIDKQEKRRKKEQRIVDLLAINRSAAYISLGEYKTAKEYLEGIDKSYLSEKNASYITYVINLVFCYYHLGEIEKAEILYETALVKLCPIIKRIQQWVEILIGERYYYQGKYDLSYEHLKRLLNPNLDKRQYLEILYYLAQMDVMNGATEQAIKRFKKIEKLGNKLWIVKSSRDMLNQIENTKITI